MSDTYEPSANIDERELDRWYEVFKKVDVPTVISIEEMNEYAPLYDPANFKLAMSGELDLVNEKELTALSKQLYDRLNTFMHTLVVPAAVVERYDNHELTIEDIEKMCDAHEYGSYRLPAIYMRLSRNVTYNRFASSALAALSKMPEDNIAPTLVNKKRQLTASINDAISQSQNMDNIVAQAKLTRQQTEEFIRYKNGVIEKSNQEAVTKQTPSPAVPENMVDSDDMFEFEFDE